MGAVLVLARERAFSARLSRCRATIFAALPRPRIGGAVGRMPDRAHACRTRPRTARPSAVGPHPVARVDRSRRGARMSPALALNKLAKVHGVQTGFFRADGERREASPETLYAVLKALDVEARSESDVRAGLEQFYAARQARCIEPVILA